MGIEGIEGIEGMVLGMVVSEREGSIVHKTDKRRPFLLPSFLPPSSVAVLVHNSREQD